MKELLDRYAPTLAVIAVLSLLVLIVPERGGKSDDTNVRANAGAPSTDATDTTPVATGGSADAALPAGSRGAVAAGTSTGRSTSSSGAAPSAGGSAPAQAGAAAATSTGTVTINGVTFGKGPNCRPDGRQDQIWLYAPLCVEPWPKGQDNGGSTDIGVTRDKVVIARYIPQVDPATQAALKGAGAEDTQEEQKRIYETLRRYENTHAETYGREVVFVDVPASGANDNDEALKSDAIRIANEVKAFAVFGQTLPSVFAEELANRGVPCTCIRSQSRGYYKRNPGMIFGDLPTIEDYYVTIAEYVGKRLANRPAKWADDPAGVMQQTNRKFGLI